MSTMPTPASQAGDSPPAGRPRRASRAVLVAAVMVGGLAAGVVLTEAALQVFRLPRLTYEFDVPFRGVEIELDPDVLFRFRPNPTISLNRLGYRDREFGPRRARRRITVSGDSFVMGWKVAAEQTIPKRLEGELGASCEVLNLGAIGYGPDQLLLRFEAEVGLLSPDVAVLAVFPGNDFPDLEKNRLFRVDERGRVVRSAANPVRERWPALRLPLVVRKALTGGFFAAGGDRELAELFFADYLDFAMLRDDATPAAAAKKRLMDAVLRRFGAVARRHGAAYVVLIIPSFENLQDDRALREHGVPRDRYFRLEELVEGMCAAAGLRCLSLRKVFPPRPAVKLFDSDHHLSAAGNALAARALKRLLEREGLLR